LSSVRTEFKRILLKLSGESLAGETGTGISPAILEYFASEVKKVHDLSVQVAIVIGGGNIFRGLSQTASKMDRVTADHMGMLATMINSLALKDGLLRAGVKARCMSAVAMNKFADSFDRDRAIDYLEDGEVMILGSGTGNPFFTTDTAAVLRAVEIRADVVLKGTRVDGVYDADPEKVTNARMFHNLTYMEVLSRNLQVMDSTAITLARDNSLPILVFNFNQKDNLKKIILGESIGTKVQG
jgi:uridylate kinase